MQRHRPSYRNTDESADGTFYDKTSNYSTPKHYSKTTVYKDRFHHPTVVTLDRILKEQEVLRAETRAERSADKRTVHGLQNVFEKPLTDGSESDTGLDE